MSNMSPTNSLVSPMLTDMYQISMTYAHWKNKKVDQHAVFDLFFRTNPFHGEFCIFAGLDEVLRLLKTFRFHAEDVKYLQSLMPNCEAEFFDWLLTLDCSKTKVYSLEEGSVRFFINVTLTFCLHHFTCEVRTLQRNLYCMDLFFISEFQDLFYRMTCCYFIACNPF